MGRMGESRTSGRPRGGSNKFGAYFTREDDKELESLLKNFGAAVAKKPIRTALRAGQKLITDEAKARAPTDTGNMKAAIATRALKSKGRAGRKQIAFATTISETAMKKLVSKNNAKTGGNDSIRNYFAQQEFGWKAGPKKGFARFQGPMGEWITLTSKNRRHISGKGFFRVAFDAKQDAAGRRFARVLGQAITFIWLSKGNNLKGFKAGN